MSWPFLYFAGDRLSTAELTCARLDGDVVEVGEAYMPADAVETRELRAASLRERVPETLAATRDTAAWVHGAVPDPPSRHSVQRRSPVRLHHVIDARLSYRDQLMPADAIERIGGVWVTTPERTLADLVRALHAGDAVVDLVEALLAWRSDLAAGALEMLEGGPAMHHKRPALEFLRARAAVPRRGQDEVTRYTS